MMKKTLLSLAVLTFTATLRAVAQGCSVCTQTASQLGKNGAEGLNMGIIYLAFLPLTLIAVLAIFWWRHNRARS